MSNQIREWRYASVDLANDVTTITAVPCLVKGWDVTTAISAHNAPVQDATTPVFVIPASTTAGTGLEYLDPIRFETSLVVDPDNAATGIVTIYYKPMR